jgi:NAD(P)-dependent dehydrogenase (short-subunit alcohol dehydrogenase family)
MAYIIISGASRGIGFELAKQHSEVGDRVFALCRQPAVADKLNALAAASRGKVSVHPSDVVDDASVRAGAASTGNDMIDVIYSVAGVVGTVEPELETANWDVFDEAINIMVKGPLRVVQAYLPRLKAGSKVINLSSQIAASTWPYGGFYGYSAAKAALNRMMRSVAIDLKDKGIIIGLIHPGYVQTDMGGPSAEITPEASATGIRKVTADWTLERSGDFLKWNGETHPW